MTAKTQPKPVEDKTYVVAETGRATGSLKTKGDKIKLTQEQAKLLLLGGQIIDPNAEKKTVKTVAK